MNWSNEHGMVVRRTGGGPEIVWIHGLGESSVSFEPVIATMPGFQHTLIDLPGYGRAPWPEHAMSLDALADHLIGWLASVSGPRAALVGHSMGGVLATLIAERSKVRAVINIDGNISRGDCTFSGKAAVHTLDEFRAHGFAALRAQVYADGATSPALRGYHAAMCFAQPEMFHRHAHDLVAISESGSLAGRFAALTVPALFVAGVPDGICAASRALLDRHGARWVGIEPAGHWVYLDQLERFVAEILPILRA